MLLDHPDTQEGMIPEEKLDELNVSIYCKGKSDDVSSSPEDMLFPTTNAEFLRSTATKGSTPILNVQSVFVATCLEKIAEHQDTHAAR